MGCSSSLSSKRERDLINFENEFYPLRGSTKFFPTCATEIIRKLEEMKSFLTKRDYLSIFLNLFSQLSCGKFPSSTIASGGESRSSTIASVGESRSSTIASVEESRSSTIASVEEWYYSLGLQTIRGNISSMWKIPMWSPEETSTTDLITFLYERMEKKNLTPEVENIIKTVILSRERVLQKIVGIPPSLEFQMIQNMSR